MAVSANVNSPKTLAEANNYLAISLHRLLAEEKRNVFFSPLSISTAMAMLLCGAEGKTAAEMTAALGYDHIGIRKEDIASIFGREMSQISQSRISYTLSCANCMLSQKGFNIKDQYKAILAESFKALLLEVDFCGETQKVVSQINTWVREKTHNMIPVLVSSLDSSIVVVLLNAVYFKGTWLTKFNEAATYKQTFYNNGFKYNWTNIDMMHATKQFLFFENESFQALHLPYVGEEVAMLVLLPRAIDGLDSLEAALTPSFIEELGKYMRKQEVKVSLPKFRLDYSKSLAGFFRKLGVGSIFELGAELGIISDSRELYVSEIFHKAVLEVNEEGTVAAAATMTAVAFGCATPTRRAVFVADHPFVFFIYDARNNLILFMGRVEELV